MNYLGLIALCLGIISVLLGIQYMNEGGEKLKEAFDLFRRAAIGGSADGHFNLGK